MKKNYKEVVVFLGISDVARLKVFFNGKMEYLNFGSDGEYRAYIIDGETEIPDYYKLVMEGENSISIEDDIDEVYFEEADKIKVYRAGDFGCIIQLIGSELVKKREMKVRKDMIIGMTLGILASNDTMENFINNVNDIRENALSPEDFEDGGQYEHWTEINPFDDNKQIIEEAYGRLIYSQLTTDHELNNIGVKNIDDFVMLLTEYVRKNEF